MRAVVQRARDAAVTVDGDVVGSFAGPGLVVLVGITHDDTPARAARLADKVYDLRIFEGPTEQSACDLDLPVLVVSQFTLYADTRKGRRPTWELAAPRPVAEPLVTAVAQRLVDRGATVPTGVFGADMRVTLTNEGPMTVIIDVTD
ncbi:MAG: D-aminoacyl-tRNA deacylase [bacterium]|nr:D-aminoacyl-tRNA deacylase [bacterium]